MGINRRALSPPLSAPSLGTLLFLSLALFLTGCPLDFADLDEPRVLNLTISPSAITQAETSSTTDTFSIEISLINFDDQPDYANVFIQETPTYPIRYSASQEAMIEGNLVLIDDIDFSWFQGYAPGVYSIGVEIESPTVTLVERNQATVTINP